MKYHKLLTAVFDSPAEKGSGRGGSFILDGESFPLVLQDLPTIVESYKTYDDINLVKTADIGQVSHASSTCMCTSVRARAMPQACVRPGNVDHEQLGMCVVSATAKLTMPVLCPCTGAGSGGHWGPAAGGHRVSRRGDASHARRAQAHLCKAARCRPCCHAQAGGGPADHRHGASVQPPPAGSMGLRSTAVQAHG